MNRLPTWPAAFAAFLAQHHQMPFQWGVQDCCQFARKNVIALRGADPAKSWKLRSYKTAKGALSQLHRLGGIGALPARAGLKEVPLAMAMRGDLAEGEVRGQTALGVVTGEKAAFAGPNGLEFVFVLECKRAWRV